MFGEPNEDLEDAEILDRHILGGKLGGVRYRDVLPGGHMDGLRCLLRVDVVILGDPRASLLAFLETGCLLVNLDTQEFFVRIVYVER